jgi:hypothetical protein
VLYLVNLWKMPNDKILDHLGAFAFGTSFKVFSSFVCSDAFGFGVEALRPTRLSDLAITLTIPIL